MSKLTDDILARVDIVDVISKYVPLKRSGSNFSGLSPFQNEKTPSFIVSPSKQIFKDFSSGLGGNVITFVMEFEKVDFWDAVQILAKDHGIDLSKYQTDNKKYEDYGDDKEKIKRIHKLAQQFFVDELHKSKDALSYLTDKRHLDDATLAHFGIGYSPDSHYALLQYIKAKGFTDADLLETSLSKKGQTNDSYSFFRKRIMFPIFDTMQNIVGFGARSIDPNDQPKYLNSSDHKAYDKSSLLYGLNRAKQHIKTFGCIIIVEGYMDVIALHRLGFPVAVATCGTSLTEQHIKIIKRYTDNVYFLFDSDLAGQNATLRALGMTYQHDIFPKKIMLPEGYKDADDLANLPNGKEVWEQCFKQAKDGFLATFEYLRRTMDISSPIDKQKILNTLFGLILKINSIPLQDHYLHVLAEHVGLAYEIILPQYKQYAKTEGKFHLRQKTTQQTKSYQPDREALSAALFVDNFLQKYAERSDLWNPLFELKDIIITYLPEQVFSKIILDNTTQAEFRIPELQLRWEKELEEKDEDKRYILIKQTIGQILQSCLQQLLKHGKLSAEEKHKILTLSKNISK